MTNKEKIMAMTNKERNELKAQGYQYHRRFGKWMKEDEIERLERAEESTEMIMTALGLISALAIFIWIFSYN